MWEVAGVVPDPHSSTVLALGLPGGPDSPLARWLAEAAGARQPVVLSLANLRRWPVPPLPAGSEVFVVENPSLIAEALRAGTRSPLVCSSGRPTVATVTLLRQLGAQGALLYQHADFDPAGLSITAWLAAVGRHRALAHGQLRLPRRRNRCDGRADHYRPGAKHSVGRQPSVRCRSLARPRVRRADP